MSEATPYTPTTLDAVGEATSAIDLRTVTDSVVVIGKVSGVVTFVLEVSNDERTSRAYITVGTYTADIVKRLRGAMPRYLRARMTAGTGSVDIGFGKARNWDGKLSEVNEESRYT